MKKSRGNTAPIGFWWDAISLKYEPLSCLKFFIFQIISVKKFMSSK
jgi:hypothetical protein